jgi:Uncharacterized conserved protein
LLRNQLPGRTSLLFTKNEGQENTEVAEGFNDSFTTTEEEIEGYCIIISIMRSAVDPKRIIMRDKENYCGILLDTNNRKPIRRLHFNTRQKYLELFVDEDRKAEKTPLNELNAIYNYPEKLIATVNIYEKELIK